MKTFTLHLDAGHNLNGNPRRAFVVFDANGRFLETIDEGYQGNSAVTIKYPDTVFMGSRIKTTPSQIREARRTGL